jgi:hypothetical protein
LGTLVAAAVAAACGGLPNLGAQERTGPPGAPAPDPAAEVARLTRNVPGDSTPIVVGADDVATWVENGQRIVMARGKVLVQEGVVQIRANQAVTFVDLRAGILHMEVYAEGEVQIDNSSAVKTAPRAFVSLTTRGEFRLRAYKNKVLQQSLTDDPLIQRARTERAASAPSSPAVAAPTTKTSASANWPPPPPRPPAEPPGPVRQVDYEEPQAPQTGPQPTPAPIGPPMLQPTGPTPPTLQPTGPTPPTPPSQPGAKPPPVWSKNSNAG